MESVPENRLDQYVGNYHLIRLLGKGSTASVYLGEHRYLKRLAAIKILHTVLSEPDKERFLEEARLLAKLSHPNIISIHECAVAQNINYVSGRSFTQYIPYLVMDFAAGNSLRVLYPTGTCLFTGTVIDYIKQIATALQYAHTNGIIHRDVKPENCLLSEQGTILLSDFGIALFAPTPELLSTQQMAGTLQYAAPEQLRGKPDFASDQYSLAVMSYEWLCGTRPFEGKAAELIIQHLSSPLPPLRQRNSTITPAIQSVVERALQKDPQLRYPSIQAFANALEHAYLNHESAIPLQSHSKQEKFLFPARTIDYALTVDVHTSETMSGYSKKLEGYPEEKFDTLTIEQKQPGHARNTQKLQKISRPLSLSAKKNFFLKIGIAILLLLLIGSGLLHSYYTSPVPTTHNLAVASSSFTGGIDFKGGINFTVRPYKMSGITLRTDQSNFADDHVELGASQHIILDFNLPGSPAQGKVKQAIVYITGLVARSGNNVGYAPLDLYSNDQIVVQSFTLPGQGFRPNTTGFQIPPGQLVYGKNELKLVINRYAEGAFWLYHINVSTSLPTTPATINFTTHPAAVHDLTLAVNEAAFKKDHAVLGAGQQIAIDFTLPGSPAPGKSKIASVVIKALTARSGNNDTYAPLDVYSNGQIVMQSFIFPGHGFQPETINLQIPPGQLVYGKNELKLSLPKVIHSELWVYSVGILPGLPTDSYSP